MRSMPNYPLPTKIILKPLFQEGVYYRLVLSAGKYSRGMLEYGKFLLNYPLLRGISGVSCFKVVRLLLDAFGHKFMKLFGYLSLPDAHMTRSDGYLCPVWIDDANLHGHGRLIDPLGSDRGLGAVGLLFKDGLFEVS